MDYRIEQLRYLLREDPSSRIFYQLGELLRREGDAEGAVKVLVSGLERHPRYVAPWVSLGRSYRDLGSLDEAERALESALEIDRENAVAARLLGETAVERGDWLRAVKALKLARALTGADQELDTQIAVVEEHLAEDGRLEGPEVKRRRSGVPARHLEVVSLSADDPFSDSAEQAGAQEAADDVFEIAEETVEEVVGDDFHDGGTPVLEDEVAGVVDEEPAVADAEAIPAIDDETPAVEEPGDVEIAAVEEPTPDEADEEDFSSVEADEVEELPEPPPDPILTIDESSVGAWAAGMKAAGVTGDEAWTEPTAELITDGNEILTDGPWTEPGAGHEPSEISHEEPVTIEEPEIAEEPAREAFEPVLADEVGESPDLETSEESELPVDDEPAPVERATFDSIEATHPIVVEKRALEAARILDAEIDEPSVDDAVLDDDAVGDDPALPGEDRGVDSVEVTRPIAVDEQVEHVAVRVEELEQDPVVDTAEEPFEESPMETSEEPIEEPVQDPVLDSADDLSEEPAMDTPVEPIAEPVDEPDEEPIEEPVVESAEVPVTEPIDEPDEEPIEAPSMESAAEAIEDPLEERVFASDEVPVVEPVEEPADGPALETLEETEEPDQLVHEGADDTDGEETHRRHGLEHGVPLPTMTLAKLALEQDDRPLAMATLESLIERDPANGEAIALLEELTVRDAAVANERIRARRAPTKIAALQGWLDAVRLAAERRVQ